MGTCSSCKRHRVHLCVSKAVVTLINSALSTKHLWSILLQAIFFILLYLSLYLLLEFAIFAVSLVPGPVRNSKVNNPTRHPRLSRLILFVSTMANKSQKASLKYRRDESVYSLHVVTQNITRFCQGNNHFQLSWKKTRLSQEKVALCPGMWWFPWRELKMGRVGPNQIAASPKCIWGVGARYSQRAPALWFPSLCLAVKQQLTLQLARS